MVFLSKLTIMVFYFLFYFGAADPVSHLSRVVRLANGMNMPYMMRKRHLKSENGKEMSKKSSWNGWLYHPFHLPYAQEANLFF